MARRARIQYAGAVYHVLDRGDRREAIFVDDQDRLRFLAIARTVRMHTTVTNRWLAETLRVGHVSRLSGRALEQNEVQKLSALLEDACEFITRSLFH